MLHHILLLFLQEGRTGNYFLPVHRKLPYLPQTFKADQDCSHTEKGQLPQHWEVHQIPGANVCPVFKCAWVGSYCPGIPEDKVLPVKIKVKVTKTPFVFLMFFGMRSPFPFSNTPIFFFQLPSAANASVETFFIALHPSFIRFNSRRALVFLTQHLR